MHPSHRDILPGTRVAARTRGAASTAQNEADAARQDSHRKDGERVMARKVVNRKELRAQADAAEAAAKSKKEKPAKDKPAKEKKAKAEKAPKPAAKKPSRKKVVKDVRMKAYWGVFNQTMKRLAMFEYADKRAAQKKAAELGGNHFVQLVKEAIVEA
jgi:hypothetical protein